MDLPTISSIMAGRRTDTYKTTCSYCGVGCGIKVTKDAKGHMTVSGDEQHPVNRGMLCSKGRNLHYVVEDQTDRLLYPTMRWSRSHPLQRVSWDDAINRVAAVFKTLIKKYGPDSVGFYVSGQCLTEEYYLANKITKGFIGTNNIDTNSRLCMSSAVVGYKMTIGDDAPPISYDDIELADCFFITGANPAWCHPILYRRLEAHKESNPKVKVIVADPRKTQTAAAADLHLQLIPGTDITLYHAISRIIIENDWVDAEFIENYTDGYASLKETVMRLDLKQAADTCGVPLEDIRLAAQYIGNSKGYISMWTMGLNQSVIGVNKNLALLNISVITGQIGKPGSGPFSLTGQPNAMGGREVGGMANLLAAHKNLASESDRQEVADFWGVPQINDKPGLTATEMFKALESGKMKAVWIICTNPMVSLPDVRQVERGLKNAKFVVVQDISALSDTVQYADLVLPAAGWTEKDGTMTNSDRRISYLPSINQAPGEALPDTEILIRFAKAMGWDGFDYGDTESIFNEHRELTRGTNIDITGLSYDYLKNQGTAQWPFPEGQSAGTPRLFTDNKFWTPNQKAQIHTTLAGNQSEKLSPDFPLILTTGRIRDQWHTMTRTGKVEKLNQHISTPFLEIHPIDALARGIEQGDNVVITSERGEVRVTADITENIRQGVVFLPMHWGKILQSDHGRANNVTNSLVDPTSKEPDFKFSAVQVAPYVKKQEKIVVVGAGAAAYRFINTYRDFNKEDEIHVFSLEEHPFYNRVLLPEYLTGHLTWEQLEKIKDGEIAKLGVNVHKSLGVASVDRENKTITDTSGAVHSYDRLLLGTGSSPFKPPNYPKDMEGVFTMRSRGDADRLRDYLNGEGHVVIVGGGLLGLELAASLKEANFEITIIQRSPRLMERQLDIQASELLQEDVSERGIDMYFNNEVQTVYGRGKIESIMLKSGKTIPCDAIVYAIGTKPNIGLARESGIKCNRGVVVNEYLQTSDSNVFAMGEIAEFKQNLCGITAAAEEQADIAARFITGNKSEIYKGSVPMNILKFEDLNLCSIGQIEANPGDDGVEEVIFLDKRQRYYKKCVVRNDRLIGAILIGDKNEFAEFKMLIENRTELSEKRVELLRSGGESKQMIGELVCSCNNVGAGNIQQAIDGGCTDFKKLCQQTGAGLGCGSCKPEVKAILENSPVLQAV